MRHTHPTLDSSGGRLRPFTAFPKPAVLGDIHLPPGPLFLFIRPSLRPPCLCGESCQGFVNAGLAGEALWRDSMVMPSASRMFRPLRKRVTASLSHALSAAAPHLPEWAIRAAEAAVRTGGPATPVLSGMVRRNMRAAGVERAGLPRAYFEQVARHLGNALRIFAAGGACEPVRRLAEREIDLETSALALQERMAGGRGLIVAPAHVCNYLLTLVRLNQVIPLCVYLRWSNDERRRAMKEKWCRSAGLDVILEPPSATDPTSRAMACVEAVRSGKALVMTPDVVQKADRGVGVELLKRVAYLPSGPASIAMLAEAPLVPVFGRMAKGIHWIYACDPIEVTVLPRAQGGRPAAVQQATQAWARHFEAFLREQPDAWFFWGDSLWTRHFGGEPRYCGRIEETRPGAVHQTPPALRVASEGST